MVEGMSEGRQPEEVRKPCSPTATGPELGQHSPAVLGATDVLFLECCIFFLLMYTRSVYPVKYSISLWQILMFVNTFCFFFFFLKRRWILFQKSK